MGSDGKEGSIDLMYCLVVIDLHAIFLSSLVNGLN